MKTSSKIIHTGKPFLSRTGLVYIVAVTVIVTIDEMDFVETFYVKRPQDKNNP